MTAHAEPWPVSDDEMWEMHVASAQWDGAKITHFSDRLDDQEAVARAKARAAQIIAGAAADGTLDLLAGHLSRSSFLSGEDVADILHGPRFPAQTNAPAGEGSAGGSVPQHPANRRSLK